MSILKVMIGATAICLGAVAAHAIAPAGDPERGAEVYQRCAGCHSLDQNRVGPAHRGVFGRIAGSLDDFNYSPALAEADIVWDTESLDGWLADPRAFIPGSRMGYRLRDPQDRADVIAFLARESEMAGSP